MQQMPALAAAALWSGLLILLLVVLSGRVIAGRWRHRVSTGDGSEGQLTLASRSFGNAAEYIPTGIAALILLALVGGSITEVHIIGGLLLAGRLMHPVGLALRPPNLFRVGGMILTLLALLFAALLLILAAIPAL